MSEGQQHSAMMEFIEDALGFELKPWQREMVRRFYLDQIAPEQAAQAEEARHIDEQSERQDEARLRVYDLLMKEGPVNRKNEEPGRHYSRTRAQQAAIDKMHRPQARPQALLARPRMREHLPTEEVRLLVVDEYPKEGNGPGQRMHVYATLKELEAMANGETVQFYPHLVEELPPRK